MSPIFEGSVHSSDGLFYGREWQRDTFDRCVDDLLQRKYKHATPFPAARCVALDIGCYTGLRASLLARSGLFGEVIACDINDYSDWISTRNKSSPVPIRFRQMNAVDLGPELFEGKHVSHVNFRRVGHFLPPDEFRLALSNIGNIVGDHGLVSVSFDDRRANNANLHPRLAPYWQHDGDEIKSFLEELGFGVQTIEGQDSGDGENEERASGFNEGATHLLAFAPVYEKRMTTRTGVTVGQNYHIASL